MRALAPPGAHPPRRAAAGDHLHVADRRVGAPRLPRARPSEGAAEARAGHPLVLPARAEGPTRPQGVDAAPRDAAPARYAADASRPARGARPRPRHEPPAENRSVLDVARRRREGSLGPPDRD